MAVMFYRNTFTIDGDFPSMNTPNTARSPANYQIKVLDLLKSLEKTETGKALMNGLCSDLKSRNIRIIPAPFDKPTKTQTTEVDKGVIVIEYNPWTWAGKDTELGIDPTGKGYDADDVLFHELVHAFLKLSGVFKSKPRLDGFDDREDFYAILFTNIYVSELSGISPDRGGMLRADHKLEFHEMTSKTKYPNVSKKYDMTNDRDFLIAFKFEIDDLFEVEHQPAIKKLVTTVKNVNCKFNPFWWRSPSGIILGS
jgi:hypothetical protein